MTRTARLLSLLGILGALVLAFADGRGSASAAVPYAVSATPAEATVAPGGTAVFRVKVEGQTANLPTFQYDVQGGELAAVTSLDPTAANVAEGAVFVTRDGEGVARLTISLGNEVLATGQVRFANMGTLTIELVVNAGPDAAARTWRYEVLTPGGQLVATLDANTSGDAPLSRVSTAALPYGFYTVRQVLGSDTRTSCAAGVFYEAVNPETTLELAANVAVARFEIRPCPSLPANLGVDIPVDTIVPAGETPISEVRGAREEGPGALLNPPLAPAAGNTRDSLDQANNTRTILFIAALLMLLPGAGLMAVAARRNTNR